jgi:multimeric flavodoxin WrbA
MNDKILCIYYSRTGGTKQAVEEIASALDCECLALHDKVDRSGALGFLRCCMDAVRKRTSPVSRPQSARPLADYELVVLGTPIWAGRCSSVMRGFLKRRGYELQNTAYVVTHRSGELYRDVYRQMDLYLQTPHVADVSLRVGSAGYHFWRDRFIKTCADFVAEDKN